MQIYSSWYENRFHYFTWFLGHLLKVSVSDCHRNLGYAFLIGRH